METVFGMMSRLGPFRSFGGYKDVLKRVLTRVDFPRPDSPLIVSAVSLLIYLRALTNDHDVEVKALADTLAVPLIG